jgi:predicted DCC family thiol-disulfide oxidoreductase YuxK
VFFDGACHLCSREISHYRRQDKEGRLGYVDIAAPGFDAGAHGLTKKAVHREMHVQSASGEWLVGLDAFVAIWEIMPGWGWMAKVSKVAGIHQLMGLGYAAFSRLRPLLPRRKDHACNTGACDV